MSLMEQADTQLLVDTQEVVNTYECVDSQSLDVSLMEQEDTQLCVDTQEECVDTQECVDSHKKKFMTPFPKKLAIDEDDVSADNESADGLKRLLTQVIDEDTKEGIFSTPLKRARGCFDLEDNKEVPIDVDVDEEIVIDLDADRKTASDVATVDSQDSGLDEFGYGLSQAWPGKYSRYGNENVTFGQPADRT